MTELHPTPFGFFDKYQLFQQDADAMVVFILRTLGEDVLGVELTKPMIWGSFETATREFNGFMIEYQNKSNLASLLGMPTGSVDGNGINNINVTDLYVQQNLEFLKNLSAPYAGMIGLSQTENTFSGSVVLSAGRQDYDLYTELLDPTTKAPLFSMQPAGSVTSFEVVEVYHNAPAQYIFNSNLASNFVATGLPVESYIPDTRFYVLPLFEDVLRAGMLETASRIRRSHYSYKISGRSIRIFPAPNNLIPGLNSNLWMRVRFAKGPFPNIASTILANGASFQPTGSGTGASFQNDQIFGANGPFNTPFGPLNYNSLNMWSRNWIAQMTLALSLIQLGRIRGKFKSFPIPGAELSLNGDDLVSAGKEDKEKLNSSLKETLESLTFDKIAEREAAKAESMVKQLAYVPMPAKYAIFIAALCIMLCI